MKSICRLVGALLLVPAATANAQDIFRLKGDIRMTPAGLGQFADGEQYGSSGDGFLVTATGDTAGITCWRERTNPNEPFDARNPFVSVPGGGAITGVMTGYALTHAPAGSPRTVVRATVTTFDGMLELRAINCGDIPVAAPLGWDAPVLTGGPIPIDVGGLDPAAVLTPPVSFRPMAWPDRVCMPIGQEIWCVNPSDASPMLRRLVTAQDIGDQLPLDATLLQIPKGIPIDFDYTINRHIWRFVSVAPLPDGRMVAVVGSNPPAGFHQPAASLTVTVVIDANGRLERMMHEPTTQLTYTTSGVVPSDNVSRPLFSAPHVFYVEPLDAVFVGPIDGWEWSGSPPVYSAGDGSTLGWYGRGYFVLPVGKDTPRDWFGYFPLSDAIARSGYGKGMGTIGGGLSDEIPTITQTTPDGDRLLLSLQYPNPNGNLHYIVTWNNDALDLDRDGLTRAEEHELGTSDFDWDTDHDFDSDGYEVLTGTSPTRDNGGRSQTAFDTHAVTWSYSDLIRWRIPTLTTAKGFDTVVPIDPAPGIDGPLCAGGRCYDAAGNVVAEATGTKSIDGRLLVDWWDVNHTAYAGIDLTTGERWRWVGVDDITAALGVQQSRVTGIYAENRDSLLLAVVGYPVFNDERGYVVGVDRYGNVTVLFDQQKARCDSGLGTCDDIGFLNTTEDNYLNHHDIEYRWQDVGYDPVTERVLVHYWGVWDSYLVGIHRTDPPEILYRAHDFARHAYPGFGDGLTGVVAFFLFPEFYRPTPYGSFFGAQDTHGAWGDTTLTSAGVEKVAIEHMVEPGDVLGLASVNGESDQYNQANAGAQLYRIGARGGLAPLWAEPIQGLAPTGMDVSTAGRLCVATPEGVVEFVPTDEDRVPRVIAAGMEVEGALDCLYEDEDSIVVLTAEPAAVQRWRRGVNELEPVETLSGRPRLFVREHDGGYTILDSEGARRGDLSLADGTRLTLQTGDGSPIYNLGGGLEYADSGERYKLVERPDGLIVVIPIDPELPRWTVPAFFHRDASAVMPIANVNVTKFAFTAIARVPGGLARDPWTGRPLRAGDVWPMGSDPSELGAGGPGTATRLGPEAPVAPTGGVALEGEGCTQAPSSGASGAFWGVLAGLWVLARKRNR